MKANELMINDWYQWYADGKYYQYQVKAEDFIKDYVANFEPIPLTKEILEKNAYPEDGSWYSFGDFYVAKYGNCFVIHQNPNDDKREFLCRIQFVHELQHLLRLCGLNDLADNFKV